MKRLFRKLTDFFSPIQPTNHLYNLRDSEVIALKHLRAYPEFNVLLSALDTLCIINGEALLTTRATDDLHFQRGYISGLRKAALLVDEILIKETQLASERRPDSTPDRRIQLAILNTPAFKR